MRAPASQLRSQARSEPDSAYAWVRLAAAVLIGTMGNVGMWSVVVVLPAVQAEFGVARGSASLPYTLTLVGFGLGGVMAGRLADKRGIMVPVVGGALALGIGYAAAAHAQSLWQFALIHGLVIGFLGTSTTFAPLIADISLWFRRRRGIAVAICASGNYLAGAIWPPLLQWSIAAIGWRSTYALFGLACTLTILPLTLFLRRPSPRLESVASGAPGMQHAELRLPPAVLQGLLVVAGVACCVAMSMPQVHIVAYCADLGYGAQRGAEMLSVMLALGVVSRLVSGVVSDYIGGLRTLLLGSVLQGIALVLYIPFDGLSSLYVVSGLFGLFQGGIVPAYALIVREYYSPREAGQRVGVVLMATLFGMALGGWMSGTIYDATGSYRAAFMNGVAWNLLNVLIVTFLLSRRGGRDAAGAGTRPAPAE